MEQTIDILILLGVFYFTFKWLAESVQWFDRAKEGVSFYEAGCTFLLMSILCASFFPIRQHVADSTANAVAREKAAEEGIIIEPGTGNEVGEAKLIHSIITCLIVAFFAFIIRCVGMFAKDITPIFYGIIVWPIIPVFLYHFVSWGCR
ncbi:hypothetical protein HN803_00115 [candidate division WWE3 bacterium]|jgi:hypothetical protein|nr:hypothetical protein [Candidatus Scalindua sp.]MBT7349189.1 hypothetical protein [candidate division WWE3 bacterium]